MSTGEEKVFTFDDIKNIRDTVKGFEWR